MKDKITDPLSEFRKINTEATYQLAVQSKKNGVKKFIYLSTIKVNGEKTYTAPFKSSDAPHPSDSYSVSKFEAEKKLLSLHEPNKFEIIIIRPPLIYGPGVRANFALLMKLVRWPIPLPFGSVKNKRSMVSVFNLSDLILKCINTSFIEPQILLVSDNTSYSLKDLLIKLSQIQNKKIWLFPFPVFLINFIAYLLGFSNYTQRLLGNLEIDIENTKIALLWHPPYTFEQTFKEFTKIC